MGPDISALFGKMLLWNWKVNALRLATLDGRHIFTSNWSNVSWLTEQHMKVMHSF
jgi:hypothetical protein